MGWLMGRVLLLMAIGFLLAMALASVVGPLLE